MFCLGREDYEVTPLTQAGQTGTEGRDLLDPRDLFCGSETSLSPFCDRVAGPEVCGRGAMTCCSFIFASVGLSRFLGEVFGGFAPFDCNLLSWIDDWDGLDGVRSRSMVCRETRGSNRVAGLEVSETRRVRTGHPGFSSCFLNFRKSGTYLWQR